MAVEVTGGPQIPFHPGREVRFFIHFLLYLGFSQGLSSCFEISEEMGAISFSEIVVVYSN